MLVFPFTPQDSAPGALSRGEGEEPGLVCCVELLCAFFSFLGYLRCNEVGVLSTERWREKG